MKRLINKVHSLNQRATELRAAMQSIPPTIAEIRETIAATTGQLQQLRSGLQGTVADLQADSDQRLGQALQEINASLGVFLEAGCEVRRVDVEVSPGQRLFIHLHKIEDVNHAVMRALIAANEQYKTTQAILKALMQADELADTVNLTNLNYCELIVSVGPVPSVRLCWRVAELFEAEEVAEPTPALRPTPTSSASFLGESSFFGKRTVPALTPAVAESVGTPLPAGPAAPVVAVAATEVDWRQAALDRLKTSPRTSKYHR